MFFLKRLLLLPVTLTLVLSAGCTNSFKPVESLQNEASTAIPSMSPIAESVDGVCGTANGAAMSSAPTGGLCGAGRASVLSGSGPWSWTCEGAGGGKSASCSAPLPVTMAFDPNNPTTSGHTLFFDDEFDSLSTIDTAATGNPGFKWYTKKFFGYGTEPAANISIANGILTLNPTGSTGSYNIATAAPSSLLSTGYVGTTFGRPAHAYYVEARIAFDQTLTRFGATDWPAFWSLAVEHMANGGIAAQWPGQISGYEHFMENDFFEYDVFSFSAANFFGSARHDWYGKYGSGCSFCQVANPEFTVANSAAGASDWTQFHRIGQLWVLGSAENNYQGSQTMYVDGIPCLPSGSTCKGVPVSWTGNATCTMGPPPVAGSAAFSIGDCQHLVIILGTAVKWPLQVDYVRVWKKD